MLVKYEDYKKVAEDIEKNVVGVVTSNGIEITGYKTHFIDRVIGEYSETNYPLKGMRKGVPIEDVLDALQNPVQITNVKINPDGLPSIKLKGKKCWVTINPETGMLIQVNARKGM